MTSMKDSLVATGAFSKVLATLAIAVGMAMYGCSGETQRSEASKEQFKNISETEAKLLKGKAQVTKKGTGIPKSIKGKLADFDKSKTEDQ